MLETTLDSEGALGYGKGRKAPLATVPAPLVVTMIHI
jgi:hypothetical protein